MFAAALDSLQIQSLELAGVNAGVIGHDHEQSSREFKVLNLASTPQLIKQLVHLSIHDYVYYDYVEFLLYHCKTLKTLCLAKVWLGEESHGQLDGNSPEQVAPLMETQHDCSPSLCSVTLGLQVYGLVSIFVLIESLVKNYNGCLQGVALCN